jgi:hypothetical protein
LFPATTSKAQVTSLVNYQGKLQKSGTNVNGPINVTFSIFTDPTNSNNLVYQETQQVSVVNGLYSTLIGQNPSIGTIQAACKMNNTYLEVAVNGNTLSPRELFCPPPFAQSSETRWNVTTPGWWSYNTQQLSVLYDYPQTAYYLGYLEFTNAGSKRFSGGSLNLGGAVIPMCVFPAPATSVQISSANFMLTMPSQMADGTTNFWNYPQGNPSLILRLTARTLTNSVRYIGPDLVLFPTNTPAFNMWIPIPLSTNLTDLTLNSSEFLCLEMIGGYQTYMTNGSYSTVFNLFNLPANDPGTLSYMFLDIRVR